MKEPALLASILFSALSLPAQVEEGEKETEVGERQEVVDTYVDGSVKTRYTVDAKGRKNGSYERFYRGGKLRQRSYYRNNILHGRHDTYDRRGDKKVSFGYKNGKLHGKCQEFGKDDRVLTTGYADGILHGARELSIGGKTVCSQRWQNGKLVQLFGISPFPVPLVELQRNLKEIQKAPDPKTTPGIDEDKRLPERLTALRRLQAYRYLCGVPYKEMALEPSYNKACDAGAEICRQIGRLSHTPAKPAGMDDNFYRLAYRGTSRSNLAAGSGMVRQVDSYMNDSDARNIAHVGHRRWCLNPAMRKTGFGNSGAYSAMWSMDQSGGAGGAPVVFYPPQGHVPADFFGPRHAWCVCAPRSGKFKKEQVKIRITELDDTFLPIEGSKPLELDHLGVTTGGPGIQNVLLFRPAEVIVQPGKAYWVRISTDGGKTDAWRYLVHFVAPAPIRQK